MDGGWTTVRYGRRRREANRSWVRFADGGYPGWKDRAPSAFSRWRGRVPYPNPNWPVPPSGNPRYAGPQSRSYAAVVRGRPFFARPAPRSGSPRARESEDVRRQPADPQFGRLIRKMHTVIRMVHHLQNVAPKDGKEEPRMIKRMVEMLTTMIKPANPTSHTVDMIRGNAENWGYNTLTILMDHYNAGLEKVLQELTGLLVPEWKAAFQVAVRWASRNLTRLSQDVVDHAEALITTRVATGGGQQPQPQPVTPTGGTTTGTQTQVVQTAGTLSQQARRAPPATKQSVSTMTDPTSPTWSAPPPPQSGGSNQHSSPKPPREERRRRNNLEEEREQEEEERQIQRQQENSAQDSNYADLAELFDQLDAEEDALSDIMTASQTSAPVEWNLDQEIARGQEDEGDAEVFEDSADHFTHPPPPKFYVTRHMNTQRKLTDWDLVVNKKWLILGDSNLSRFPPFFNRSLQIDSYPGAHFRHVYHLMEKAWPPGRGTVEKIVLSFGMNGRENKCKETTVKNLQAAIRMTKRKFPAAEIWIPLVNFSPTLPKDQKDNLDILNKYLTRNCPFIPLLPEDEFETEQDDVHWTRDTARAMLAHWTKFLNLTAL